MAFDQKAYMVEYRKQYKARIESDPELLAAFKEKNRIRNKITNARAQERIRNNPELRMRQRQRHNEYMHSRTPEKVLEDKERRKRNEDTPEHRAKKKARRKAYQQKRKIQQEEQLKVVAEAYRVLSISKQLRSKLNANTDAESNIRPVHESSSATEAFSGRSEEAQSTVQLRTCDEPLNRHTTEGGREDSSSEVMEVTTTKEKILQYMVDNWSKQFSLNELSAAFDLTPSGVFYHLKQLIAKGLIHRHHGGGKAPDVYSYNKIQGRRDNDDLLKRIISLEKRVEELTNELSNRNTISQNLCVKGEEGIYRFSSGKYAFRVRDNFSPAQFDTIEQAKSALIKALNDEIRTRV